MLQNRQSFISPLYNNWQKNNPSPIIQFGLPVVEDCCYPLHATLTHHSYHTVLSMNTYRWISCAWLRVMLLASLTGAAIHIPLSLLAETWGDFEYQEVSMSIRITGYTGTGGAVVIPATINGMPVTEIGVSAFWGKITDPGSTLSLSQNIVKLGQEHLETAPDSAAPS